MAPLSDAFIADVIRFCAVHEIDLWWHPVNDAGYWDANGQVRCSVNCNDLFWWATSDAEEVTPETFEAFKQAVLDAEATEKGNGLYGPELYAARARKMRPQGACYKNWPAGIVQLFNACGPPRPADKSPFGNPVASEHLVKGTTNA